MPAYSGPLRALLPGNLGSVPSEVLTFTDAFTWSGAQVVSGSTTLSGTFTSSGGYTITGTGTIGNGLTVTTPAISGATITGTVTDSATTTKTGTFDMSGATVTYRAIINTDVSASAAIARSKLATDTAVIDLEERLKSVTGLELTVSEVAGSFNRVIGTNQYYIAGEATVNETELSEGWFSFVLPENYVAGGTISLRAVAGVTIAGDAVLNASSTIDMECRLQTDTTGAVGSDLVTTAAQALAAAGATFNFTVTPTSRAAGDKLICKLATSVIEDAGGTGAATAFITKLAAVIQVQG